jgi:predicted HTH transcriptional regulator
MAIKVLRAVDDNASITKPQLAKLIGQSRASVDKHIAQLKNIGILKRVRANKTGKWILHKIPPPNNSLNR